MSIGHQADNVRLKSRRLARLSFNIHVPTWVLMGAFELLPDDTHVVRCGYDDLEHGKSNLILWSEQFDPCPQSQALPEISIHITTTPQGDSVKLFMYRNGESTECQFT